MRGIVMTGAIAAMVAVATPAAADWEYLAREGGSAQAMVQAGGASLVVACGNGSLVAYYEFPKAELAEQLKGVERPFVQFQLDQDASGNGKIFSFSNTLIDWGETMGIGGGNKGAHDLANWFSRAKRKITASLATVNPGTSQQYSIYVAKEFTAAGSTSAINKVKAGCK